MPIDRYPQRMPYADVPPDPFRPPTLMRGASTPEPKTLVVEIGPDGMPYLREEWRPESLDERRSRIGPRDLAPAPPNFAVDQLDARRLAQPDSQYDSGKTGSYGRDDFNRDAAKWGLMPPGSDREAYMRQMMIDRDVEGARLARERALRAVYGNALATGQK